MRKKINSLFRHPPQFVFKDSKLGKFNFKGKDFVSYTQLALKNSAIITITEFQKTVLLIFVLVLLTGLLLNGHFTLVVLIASLTVLYFADLFFNLFIIYKTFFREAEISIGKKNLAKLPNSFWPKYAIFCPLYKEWQVVPQFIKAMSSLDYPKNKLEVVLLLEQDDKETIKKIKEFKLPEYFKLEIVPDSKPKTKPKALNYGLLKTKADYVVIYDAEDIPEPDQLKKAVLAFKKASKETVCIQAKLNFYNSKQNVLTRLFSAEYSLWFDLVLTGLQAIEAPIPLGGTSNHFKVQNIKKLLGWDAFNVTEDADLGMRIVKNGFKTAIVDSYTYEEANSQYLNWFKQRSRWIKGYIQTYLVHMRSPRAFMRSFSSMDIITFQLIIGGKVLSMLINPLMWLITFSYFAFREIVGPTIESFYPAPVFYLAVICLIFGNFLYIYYYMIGAAKRDQWHLIPFTLLIPIYWLMMSGAAIYAFWELVVRPHHWHKTLHGLHLQKKVNKFVLPSLSPAFSFNPGVFIPLANEFATGITTRKLILRKNVRKISNDWYKKFDKATSKAV